MTSSLSFLDGGSRAAGMIRARDWSAHPFGPPERWPEALRVALSLVLNSPESMILAWGPDLHFFFNDAYVPLLGPRLAWAMGERFDKVWADAWTQAKPIIDDALAGRSKRFVDLPWKLDIDRGRADTWWTFSYSRVLDAAGTVAGLFIFTNETTDRVLGDAALRESEERLRLVVEGARDHVIFTTDPGGIVTSWSAGAEAVLGWSPGEAIGRSASMIFTDEDRAKGADVREIAAAARDGSASDERWHLRQDGTRVFLNGSVHPLPVDAQGRQRGFIKVARDETARWQAQKDLEALNATLEQQVTERTAARNRLWQLSSDIMLVAGLDGTIEAVNPAWTRVLGWQEGELLRQPLFSFIHPDDLEHTIAGAAGIAAGQSYARFANRYRHKDGGYRDIVWAAGPGDGKIIAVGRDATDENIAAAALAAAEEQLRQSQKMEAVGQLTGGVAHDFNNLLTIIRSSVDLLRRPSLSAERKERYLDAVSDTVDRAARLTGQLLAFARRQALKPEVFDVGAKLRGVGDMLDTVTGARIIVSVEEPDRPCFIRADLSQFETALINMAVNARDAMEGEGRLILRLHCGAPMPSIRGHAGSSQHFAAVSVIDTGAGIPEDQLAHIFEPFFTTKDVGKGTGLGLSQVFGFAKQSGGDVDVCSATGRGTTFTLYLPEEQAGKSAAPVDNADPVQVSGSAGQRVLVVEDNVEVGQFCTQILDDLGYETARASNAEEALNLLGADGAGFDIVFSDVVMPGMGGIALAEILRNASPRCR